MCFIHVCDVCIEQSLVLVARLLQEQTPETLPSSVAQPQGHFIILPSPNCSLLIKSLAVSELVLPFDIPTLENPTKDNLDLLSDAVSKVQLSSVCFIVHVHLNLFSVTFGGTELC